ncbi:MAG: hypothetical protein OD918_06370 [Gammaproteobacteria bacterium]
MQKFKNSPLLSRSPKIKGKYDLAGVRNEDPFVKGIYFHCDFVGSVEVMQKHDCPEIQDLLDKMWALECSGGKKLQRMTVTIFANRLRMKDRDMNIIVDEIPVSKISYCGASPVNPLLFFFIHRSKESRSKLVAGVYRLSTKERVKVAVLTVSKAFHIAFKAWQARQRVWEKEKRRGSGHLTPTLPIKKMEGPKEEKEQKKEQVEEHAQIPHHQVKTEEVERPRSDSTPTDPSVVKMNPELSRVKETAVNEKTGSTHDVHMTADLEEAFADVCLEEPHSPERLRISFIDVSPDEFNFAEVVKVADTGSTEDLTAT